MTTIQRTFKISSVRTAGEMIYLDLIATESLLTTQPVKIPRPEDVIEVAPKSDTEKVAREFSKAIVDEFKRSGMPVSSAPTGMVVRLPTQPNLSLTLTVNEYQKLGKPTVLDKIKMKIEVG